jgi:hypothetical protein
LQNNSDSFKFRYGIAPFSSIGCFFEFKLEFGFGFMDHSAFLF